MNEHRAAITIGIMTHNYGRYICEAIESVLAQTRTDLELIISDDASTDGTEELVAPYLADPRIRYVYHEKNLGQAGNWGYLLEQGIAPVIGVLHADDAYLPNTLALALDAFAADSELDLFYGNWWRKVEGQEGMTLGKKEKPHVKTGYEEYRYQVKTNSWLPSATFMSRRVVCKAGLPEVSLKIMVDCEYFLRLAANASKVRATKSTLMVYRSHPANASAHSGRGSEYETERERFKMLCDDHFARQPYLKRYKRALYRSIAAGDFIEGISKIMVGECNRGNQQVRKALSLSPELLLYPKFFLDYLFVNTGRSGVFALRVLHYRRLA